MVGGRVDVYPTPEEPRTVKGRVSRINKVLGIDILERADGINIWRASR